MTETSYLAGLIHDMGKYTDAFCQYITDSAAGKVVRRGSVNHTFAGVRFALERWHGDGEPSMRGLASELIAFAAGSHHGQYDCISPDGTNGYLHRVTTKGIGYEEARGNFLQQCATLEELDRRFEASVDEVATAMECYRGMVDQPEEMHFYIGMLARQLLSSVIEGDRRDTAKFMNPRLCGLWEIPPTRQRWQDRLRQVEERLQALDASTAINRARGNISEQCRVAAARGSGIFTLTVPTGGGKTLAALRYALAAAANGSERVIFVTPLLSVLDQNAAVLRDYINDDSMVLEHHSNLVRDSSCDGELDYNELLTENWRAPVIITTLVQLLNTLLAGKTTCIRRMAALRNSVIIIDEVQSVPKSMLSQFNLALNYLSGFGGANVVLCSATQPCLVATDHRLHYTQPSELVPHDPLLWQVFCRTGIEDRCRPNGYTEEELADLVIRCAADNGSVLLVCNTKNEARSLFAGLRWQWGQALFHLSTSMCKAHRAQALRDICTALSAGQQVICVSTQLVEAGVDFSFGCVVRVLAGMDNVVQVAGRCNRHGERGHLCPVYIVNLRGEQLRHLPDIQASQDAATAVLQQFRQQPDVFDNDLAGATAVEHYYRRLYAEMKRGGQDYPLAKCNFTLLDLLSLNMQARTKCSTHAGYTLGQAFDTAGEQFHVFEDNTVDVLAPYDEGEQLIVELCSGRALHDLGYRQQLVHRASQYAVSLYEYELAKLRETGGITAVCDNTVWVLGAGYYSNEIGFTQQGNASIDTEGQHGTQQYCGI